MEAFYDDLCPRIVEQNLLQAALGGSMNINSGSIDVRPVRPASQESPWAIANSLRDRIAKQVSETLQAEGVQALVYSSQVGNYPPWVRLEAWLPVDRLTNPVGEIRSRSDLEFVVDVRPYNKHPFVKTVRLTRGNRKFTLIKRPRLSAHDVTEWTRYALQRGDRPRSYAPWRDGLLSLVGLIIRPLHPTRNPVARKFRTGFWRPSTILMALFFLLQVLTLLAPRIPAVQPVVGLVSLALIGVVVLAAVGAFRRKKIISVVAQPPAAPRNLGIVDTWSAVVVGVGNDFERIKLRLVTNLAESSTLGAACSVEMHSYRTPDGYEERERLVIAKDQGQVHVIIHQFGPDVFVGWQAFLNWAGWAETKPLAVKIANRQRIEFVDVRPGFYVPQQFDLMDLNTLSEFVHQRMERDLRSILREKSIDQEIDFEVVRGDRANALDSARHGKQAEARYSLWNRLFKGASVWQAAALTEMHRPVADPAQGGAVANETPTALAKLIPVVLVIGILAALWEFSAYAMHSDLLLPSPGAVLGRAWELLSSGVFYSHAVVSLGSLATGFGIAMVVSVVLAMLLGGSERMKSLFGPAISVLALLPFVVLAPAMILWFGLGAESKIAFVAICALFPMLFHVVCQSTPDTSVASQPQRTLLGIPVLAMIRAGLPPALTAELVVEYMGSTAGLGWLLIQSTMTFNTPTALAVVLMLLGATAVPLVWLGSKERRP